MYHRNEGYSAFLVLELLHQELQTGRSCEAAEKAVRTKCVFITHQCLQNMTDLVQK
jgi:glucan phosphorylase